MMHGRPDSTNEEDCHGFLRLSVTRCQTVVPLGPTGVAMCWTAAHNLPDPGRV